MIFVAKQRLLLIPVTVDVAFLYRGSSMNLDAFADPELEIYDISVVEFNGIKFYRAASFPPPHWRVGFFLQPLAIICGGVLVCCSGSIQLSALS